MFGTQRGADVKASRSSFCLIFLVTIGLVACAGPEPILKSNTRVQLYGKDQAEREVAVCAEKAQRRLALTLRRLRRTRAASSVAAETLAPAPRWGLSAGRRWERPQG